MIPEQITGKLIQARLLNNLCGRANVNHNALYIVLVFISTVIVLLIVNSGFPITTI